MKQQDDLADALEDDLGINKVLSKCGRQTLEGFCIIVKNVYNVTQLLKI